MVGNSGRGEDSGGGVDEWREGGLTNGGGGPRPGSGKIVRYLPIFPAILKKDSRSSCLRG